MQPRYLSALVWAAAASWLASWFLPVLKDVPGWMAFRYALAPLIPFRDAGNLAWDDHIPQVFSALTNLVFAVLLGLWFSKQMFRAGLFVRITLACLLVNLYWLVKAWREGGLEELLYGYYLWLFAFLLFTVVAALSASADRRTSRTPTGGTPS
jgi:hypothetical protein